MATAFLIPWIAWLAVAWALVVVAAAAATGLAAWRLLRAAGRARRHLLDELDKLQARSQTLSERAAAAGEDAARAQRALARAQRSLAELRLLLSLASEARSPLTRVRRYLSP